MASKILLDETPPFTLDSGTLFALFVAFSFMPAAQIAASVFLPKSISKKYYFVFIWHFYDLLNHFILEGSFLYHCLFSYVQLPDSTNDWPHPASRRQDLLPSLYNRTDRKYGPRSSTSPMARIWQEYAKADHRWGGADMTIMSIEVLTVGLAGPAALYICYLIAKAANMPAGSEKARTVARMWFIAIILATGELYGGFITFCPEWLSGNQNLAGDDPVYMWLYLVFFNMLWVIIPFGVLWVGLQELSDAFVGTSRIMAPKKSL